MPHFYKRLAALVVMCALVMGCVRGLPVLFPSSSYGEIHFETVDDSAYDPIMTIDGKPVSAEEYAYFFVYGGSYWNSMMSAYGMSWSDMFTEDEFNERVREMAENQILQQRATVQLFDKYNLHLTRAQIEEGLAMKQQSIDSLGGYQAFLDQLANVGLTEQIFDNQMFYSLAYDRVNEYLFGEGGAYQTPLADLRAYMDENYLCAKHVLISAETENAAELAKEVAERAAAGEDFDALIAEYGEDPGMLTNPDGYVFTEGDMVDEFYQGTLALGMNEISEPIASSYGWHIIQRLPIGDDFIELNRASIEQMMEVYTVDDLLDDRIAAMNIERNEEMISSITLDTVSDYLPAPADSAEDADDAAPADDAEEPTDNAE